MTRAPYMQLYVSDYLGDTMHLSCEQHGAYLLLLMAMWNAGGSLPNDDVKLRRITKLTGRRWCAVKDDVLAFFTIEGDQLVHKRLSKERQKADHISQSRSIAAKRSHSSKQLKTNDTHSAIADDLQGYTNNHNQNHIVKQLDGQDDVVVADPVRVGKTVAEIMGKANDPRWLGSWSLAQAWLSEGFDPEKDIFPVVTEVCERKRQAGQDVPYSLKYFTKAIRSHHQQRMDGTLPTRHDPKTLVVVERGSTEFAAWLEHFKSQGQKTAFRERQPTMTVPSKFPPQHSEAAE
jgi:uncharacterized protein YdaU (DUF1376 family)